MFALFLTAALLTPAQENEAILKAIDNICGDTWCEGDYKFRFQKVVLDSKQNLTQVDFTMRLSDGIEVSPTATIRSQQFYVTCKVPGYSSFAGIMESADHLNWEFYTSLSDCINSLEGRLTKIFRP